MGTAITHAVVSEDGFTARANDEVGPLFEWYFNGGNPLTEPDDPEYDHSDGGGGFREPFQPGAAGG